MGDFNVDLLKCNDDNFSQDFFDSLLSSSFIPSDYETPLGYLFIPAP